MNRRLRFMEILTVEQFIKAIEDANENILYNVESIDSGSVSLSLMGCKISTNAIEGIGGEITMFKPCTEMEVTIDLDIVNEITRNDKDNLYRLEFDNGMSDVIIKPFLYIEV